MSDAFITAAVRTPIGRAGGVLADVRPDDLAAAAVAGLVRTAALPVDRIDDVILGCANGAGEDNRNVARMAVLLAGLPVEIPGQTVNRLCGSGLQAVVSAAHAIRAGEGDLFVAGGVESMTRAPYVMLKPGKAWDRDAAAGGRLDGRLAVRQSPPQGRLDDLPRRDRRERGAVVRHRPRGAGRVRGREPAAGAAGDRARTRSPARSSASRSGAGGRPRRSRGTSPRAPT